MSRKSVVFLVLAAGFFTGAVVFAQTPAVVENQISFPVAELGNCGSKQACKQYCDDSAHADQCVSFAEKHGLMNKDEAARARKFSGALREAGGPGGCKSPAACDAFCGDVANIDACVTFAERQGLSDNHIEEAKKIQKLIKSGGQLPGGCTSKESCERYCSDVEHGEECLAFAERTGLGPRPEAGSNQPSVDQMRKFIELAKSGGTPGGCKSKETCERYCGDEANREVCVRFGVQMGFIKPEQAEAMRKNGFTGPGGCKSDRECRDFCDNPANQETCFKYGEENGLIPPEELRRAKEGLVRMRQGFEQAPPEVVSCLKSTLGPSVIEDIQSGKLTPGPQIGERMRGCFEKFGQRGDPREGLQQMPPEIVSCAREKFGGKFDAIRSGEAEFTPEMGDVFRMCGEQQRLLGGFDGSDGSPADGKGDSGSGRSGVGGPSPEQFAGFLRSAPPSVQECLQKKIGSRFDGIKSGAEPPPQEFGSLVHACFEEFQPGQAGLSGPGGRGESGRPPVSGPGQDGRQIVPGGEFFDPNRGGPQLPQPNFVPDPTRFRPENAPTPFVSNPNVKLPTKEELMKHFEGVPDGEPAAIFEKVRREAQERGGFGPDGMGGFDPAKFRETIDQGARERMQQGGTPPPGSDGFQPREGEVRQPEGFERQAPAGIFPGGTGGNIRPPEGFRAGPFPGQTDSFPQNDRGQVVPVFQQQPGGGLPPVPATRPELPAGGSFQQQSASAPQAGGSPLQPSVSLPPPPPPPQSGNLLQAVQGFLGL